MKTNNRNLLSRFATFLSMTGLLLAMLAAANAVNAAPAAIIYNNGPFITGATTKSGVAAPAGKQWSEAQNNGGDTSNANTNAGFSCSAAAPARCADNFVVPVGETWTINQVIVYGYQTGAAAGTSPFTAATLQIWNGRPGDPGSTVIFGDTATNRLATSTDTNSYRIFNTVAPPPGTVSGTTRIIWQNNLNVSPGLALTSGNYWIDFQLTASGTGASFTPPVTIVDTRYTPFQNGRQFFTGAWTDLIDAGNPATAVDVPQDLPFQLDGTKAGARAVPYSRKIDVNGDNLSDYVVTRNASGLKTWYTNLNGTNTSSAIQYGNDTDVAVPADYDGDGKTDIAVWRPGSLAYFYILQSSTNTTRIEQFGVAGDDPTIVGDYDGDGKADPAVYRAGTGGNPSFFFYRASTAASNDITRFAFGTAGDKPYPGDFDGDGKYDFSVVRNNGGNAQIFQQRTTGGFVVTNFGLFTDRFLTGDFDGDYRNDFAVVRDNGGALTWYVSTSATNQSVALPFGTTATDTPTPGDYDGDNRTDFSVFRNNGSFITFNSVSSPRSFSFGQSGDTPATAILVH